MGDSTDRKPPLSRNAKLTDEQRDEIAERYVAGEKQADLAREFGVSTEAISKTCKRRGAIRPRIKPDPATASNVAEFAKRARSILWRQNTGTEKPEYDAWTERVEELERGGLDRSRAIVRASKEFRCLHRLFREYDVSEFDPNPESHPTIRHFGGHGSSGEEKIRSEGKQQSYRESLRWAIEAAGRHLRTGETPTSCPCDAAYYLFRQAIDEPRDFMGRIGQIESKTDADAEARRNAEKSGRRSIAEIDKMLARLNEESEDDGDTQMETADDTGGIQAEEEAPPAEEGEAPGGGSHDL